MRKIKKVAIGFVFLVFSGLNFTSCIGLSDAIATGTTTTTTTLPETTTTSSTTTLAPTTTPETTTPETTTPETTTPETTTITIALEEDKGVSFLGLWGRLTAALILIASGGWLFYERVFRRSRRSMPPGKVAERPNYPKARPSYAPSSKPIPPINEPKSVEPIKTTEPLIKVEPNATTVKVDRPILLTTSAPSTFETQPPTISPSDAGLSAPAAVIPSTTPDQAKIEPVIETLSTTQDRDIVRPPQIGEQSSFARHDWWDKDREWCLVSPQGMSSDVVCDIGTSGSLAIAAASLRGHKHKVSSEPCQDAFNLRVATSKAGHNYLIAVLCDGMSSAKYSEYGARRTSQLLALRIAAAVENNEKITEQVIKSILPEVFKYCKENLIPQKRNQYGAPGVSIKDAVESDFNTTVTLLIIPTDTKSEERVEVIIGSIGDSAVFVLNNSISSWTEAAKLELNSEILNPATSAFPATFEARVSTEIVETSDLIIATSDGVGNFISVRGSQTLLGNYLAKQWSEPVNLPTFINDVGFDLKSADDDRTVIAIWLSRG